MPVNNGIILTYWFSTTKDGPVTLDKGFIIISNIMLTDRVMSREIH